MLLWARRSVNVTMWSGVLATVTSRPGISAMFTLISTRGEVDACQAQCRVSLSVSHGAAHTLCGRASGQCRLCTEWVGLGGEGGRERLCACGERTEGGARLWAPPVGHRHLGLAGVLSSTTTFSGEITAIFGSDVLSRLGF